MKKAFRGLGIALPVALLTLIAAVIKTIACFKNMDYSTGFFDGAVSVRIANAAIVVASVALLASLFIKVENRSVPVSFAGPLVYLPSGVLATSLLFLATEIIGYASDMTGGFSATRPFDRSAIIALITATLALCTIAYLALVIFTQNPRSLLRANFGMLAALFFALYTAFLFFRAGASLAQPQKIITEMVCLAAAVFFLEETRISLGRERWNAYFVLGGLTAVLAFYAAAPALAVYVIEGKVITSGPAELIFLLSLFVFASLRLIHALKFMNVSSSPLAMAISTRKAEKSQDAPTDDEFSQISIEDVTDEERQIENEEDTGN